MNMSSMPEIELQNLYIKCNAKKTESAVAACGTAQPAPAVPITPSAKCCEGHAATVVAGKSSAAAEGYLMDLHQKGECEHSYLIDLYTK